MLSVPSDFVIGAIVGGTTVYIGIQVVHALNKQDSNKNVDQNHINQNHVDQNHVNQNHVDQNHVPQSPAATSSHQTTALYHSPGPLSCNGVISDEAQSTSSETDEARVVLNNTFTEESKKEADLLLNLLYNIGESQSKRENIVHRGISCNICNSNPLTGIRFKCVNCVDYDVCSRCEPSCDHDITHVFVKIVIPIPPLANPRTSLLTSFYPGKKSVEKTLPWQVALELRECTHFDATYIEVLYEQFKSLCSDERGITKDVFNQCLGPLTSKKNLIVEQLFQFYDQDRDGFINFQDFVKGMSVMAKGSKSERIKYVFQGYDLDNDGFMSKDDLHDMLKAYHQLSMELVRDVVRSCEEEMMATYDDSGSRPISAVFNAPIPDNSSSSLPLSQSKKQENSDQDSLYAEHKTLNAHKKPHDRLSAVEAMTQDAISELVGQIMHNADLDKDGLLSQQEFHQYVLSDTSLLAWFEAIDTVF